MNSDDPVSPARKAIVVFLVSIPTSCSDCKSALSTGDFAQRDVNRLLCIDCSDLGHLVYLPSGNTALTRRSRKYSSLSAVVVKFSRSRKRNERQGVLVERAALERAEVECLSDEDARRLARGRAAEYREKVDAEYLDEFTQHIVSQFPSCPRVEAKSIASHACEKHSGRVGRSASAKNFDRSALDLAVRAHVRHVHTEYDSLLSDGFGRDDARASVSEAIDEVVSSWRRSAAPIEPSDS